MTKAKKRKRQRRESRRARQAEGDASSSSKLEPSAQRRERSSAPGERPRCGLCGKTGELTRTECCDNWICNDEHLYVPFTYAKVSCHRNHDRYTICATHHHEGHEGDWKTCAKCRKMCEPEMYAWFATNEYNFERLPNPPAYKPTHCAKCGRVIRLATDGYVVSKGEYMCSRCGTEGLPDHLRSGL